MARNLAWVAVLVATAQAQPYPAHWWTPVPEEQKASWEVLPQAARPGEVILSKRNELGILSNFAATPFTLRGKRYASAEVARMTAFAAKDAGTAAEENMRKLGIDWVTFEGRRMPYRSKQRGEHYRLVAAAMRAKMEQNPRVREILLRTGNLVLRPDHV